MRKDQRKEDEAAAPAAAPAAATAPGQRHGSKYSLRLQQLRTALAVGSAIHGFVGATGALACVSKASGKACTPTPRAPVLEAYAAKVVCAASAENAMLTQGEFLRDLMARAMGGAEVGEAAIGEAVGVLLALKERFAAAMSVGARAETRNTRAAKEIKMEQEQRAACDRGAQLVASIPLESSTDASYLWHSVLSCERDENGNE